MVGNSNRLAIAVRITAVQRSFARSYFECSAALLRRGKTGYVWRSVKKLGTPRRMNGLSCVAMMHNTSCTALLVPGVASTGSVSPT